MKILVALDGMDFEKAFAMYVQLAPHCDGFKINHTLLEHSSMFTNYEGEVMVDLKLWDTPNSVCSIVEKILETPATMCTVSTLNNEEVFKEKRTNLTSFAHRSVSTAFLLGEPCQFGQFN